MEHKPPRTTIRHLFNHAPGHAGLTAGTQGPVQQLFGATSLPELFNAIFQTAIVVGAMLAVARLVYAGFVYMTTDLPGAKGNAKAIIGEAALGLLLLLAIWVILYQINPQLLNLNILEGVQPIQRIETTPSASPPPADYLDTYQGSPETFGFDVTG